MYQRRRAAGLCVRCGKPAIDGATRCKKHTKLRNAYQLGWLEKRAKAAKRAARAKKRKAATKGAA